MHYMQRHFAHDAAAGTSAWATPSPICTPHQWRCSTTPPGSAANRPSISTRRYEQPPIARSIRITRTDSRIPSAAGCVRFRIGSGTGLAGGAVVRPVHRRRGRGHLLSAAQADHERRHAAVVRVADGDGRQCAMVGAPSTGSRMPTAMNEAPCHCPDHHARASRETCAPSASGRSGTRLGNRRTPAL